MTSTRHASLLRHHRVGLVVLAGTVAALYGAVAMAVLAPEMAGRPAGGVLSTGLSSPVPALRYDVVSTGPGGGASHGSETRVIRPAVMSRLLFGAPSTRDAVAGLPEAPHVEAPSVAEARALYDELGYRLAHVADGRMGVPRVYLAAVPEDLASLRDVDARKSVFLRTVLPLVLRVNEEIAADRARVERIEAHRRGGGGVGPEDEAWLADRAAWYKLETVDIPVLLARMDVLPPSLALAQAAEESGWGTSRFAREGNALFGQWTTDPGVKGLVPLARADDATHRVRAFDRLLDAVRAYARNLNTHPAYAELRAARRAARAAGEPVDGEALAATLHSYSERGQDYVDTLLLIMRANKLATLDRVRLGTQVARGS
ncbi:glucosaminidase domain-containing protein [Caenispirillum salinarum]|uniref:glucosaminidase domain-containing protein n=1 Tax=Caenispirillum salinarum TaxID=859058 RepID=UPI00384A8CFF